MRIRINENQYVGLTNLLVENTDKQFTDFIRQTIKNYYKKNHPENWGSITDNDCVTNEGVLDVFPHSTVDRWSILNRFDTNTKVHDKLKELFNSDNTIPNRDNNSYRNWIIDNSYNLFDVNGKYANVLVDLNKGTIDLGNANELFAVKMLEKKFGSKSNIKRFCSGSIDDTKKGKDLQVTIDNDTFSVQVKPFTDVISVVDSDGDTFFEVLSWLDPFKYSKTNVQVFMFVNVSNLEYILFQNKPNKISKEKRGVIKFYEPYLDTNIDIQKKTTKYRNQYSDTTSRVFNTSSQRLKNLIFRKSEIEKLIKIEQGKLKNINNMNLNLFSDER
jgi:hypothetical protein